MYDSSYRITKILFFPIVDAIAPVVACPKPYTVVLKTLTLNITLHGAKAHDNIGIKSIEYLPLKIDNSTQYVPPTTLLVSRHSVGHEYLIAVTAADLEGNEAECIYTISIEGKIIKENLFRNNSQLFVRFFLF